MHYQEMFQHFVQPIYQLFAARYSISPHFLKEIMEKIVPRQGDACGWKGQGFFRTLRETFQLRTPRSFQLHFRTPRISRVDIPMYVDSLA